MPSFILALDQGTTSSRAMLFDESGAVRGVEQQEYPQIYPQPGWVEHDPEDIWGSMSGVIAKLMNAQSLASSQIAGIGITNQRETTLLWERETGRPVANAIVWQDRRTATLCAQLKADGYEPLFKSKTGLPLDPYFSGTKIRWLLDNTPGLRARAERGEIAFGTVDTFLMWRLTAGKVHATDGSNASRTLLYNIITGNWDYKLLDILQIPRAILPEVKPSSHPFGETQIPLFDRNIPIAGVAGDQQAATFGQACHSSGMIKNTYGTGSFLLMNTGEQPEFSTHGLLTTVAWQLKPELPRIFALEGSIFVTGAAVQWLRDELQIIRSASEIEPLANSVSDSGGVYFVPTFAGMGTPYWDANARGTIVGLTRGTGRAHLAKATLEAVCFQTCDVVQAMQKDSGIPLKELRVDGGMSVNDSLLQMQADLLGVPVIRPAVIETTALGAAYLAGLETGYWKSAKQIGAQWRADATFIPKISEDERLTRLAGWRRAIERARNWME